MFNRRPARLAGSENQAWQLWSRLRTVVVDGGHPSFQTVRPCTAETGPIAHRLRAQHQEDRDGHIIVSRASARGRPEWYHTRIAVLPVRRRQPLAHITPDRRRNQPAPPSRQNRHILPKTDRLPALSTPKGPIFSAGLVPCDLGTTRQKRMYSVCPTRQTNNTRRRCYGNLA